MSSRAEGLKQAIVDAVTMANSNPTHPKWGHVTRMAKLHCTRRGYKSAGEGIRIGATQKATISKVEWVLPEIEEDWDRYVRRWGKKFDTRHRASKYFQTEEADAIEQSPARKAEIIRERITTWQANIVPMEEDPVPPQDDVLPIPVEDTATSIIAVNKGKAKETANQEGLSQSALGFTVGKRTTVSAKKQGKANDQHVPTVPEPQRPPKSPSDVRMSSSLPQSEAPAPVADALVPPPPSSGPNPVIAEVSEMSFLPPSFPSQLRTSTPPRDKAKAKPPPILPSSPLSSPPPTQHITLPALASPFAQRARKRGRNISPRQSDAMDISDELRRRQSPPNKKQRTADPERESSMPIPPPSTPPPASSFSNDDVSPVQRNGLGNANGLPIAPTTPERQALPTLTELLATSRRSKARPRPPSRKTKSTNPSPFKNGLLPAAEIGARGDADIDAATDREASPARTFFSSPASGSSSSSPRFRARSPVSPLFSQNPHAFAPAFVSSQPGGFLGYGRGGSQAPLPLAFGYNSQFDVEGGVSRAAELLDRDVDYADWLRDIPEVEDEAASIKQSQEGLAA
ncbi:hypothetical protein FOMPIDRAFT_96290 [Fomitopsis schrenkii]|uniref:Uncharacterized protein n=1 Tax=Fomitopsis schrenkii TaxID=2126942 RepID=S8FIY6_FOMSC|nr:hypothetical protein FOMPIDRAFT_96290 [Fomitopsis schrenkii]